VVRSSANCVTGVDEKIKQYQSQHKKRGVAV
jgi:hypothetical protein